MTDYTYSRVAALDFTTTPVTVGRSATGSVYAIGDTTFTTPLNVTTVVGGVTGTTISSDANGFFPDFTVTNRQSVVFKQDGSAFTSVLTTTDPAAGPKGDKGNDGAKGDPGDLAGWEPNAFYQVNKIVANPDGDLMKVTSTHTSGASFDETKFEYANNHAVDAITAAKISDTGSATRGALDVTLGTAVGPAVNTYLATDPSVAENAAELAQSTAGLVLKSDAGAPVSAAQGMPHRFVNDAKQVVGGIRADNLLEFYKGIGFGTASVKVGEGSYAFSVQGPNRQVGELALLHDGTVPQVILDRWAARMGVTDTGPVEPTHVTVRPSPGAGEYATPQAANAAITDASVTKPYIIDVMPGAYQVLPADFNFTVKDHVTIRGTVRDQCIIYLDMPDTSTNEEVVQASTIWLRGTAGLENLTVWVRNGRYPIHSESDGAVKDYTHRITNCVLENKGTQGIVDYRTANSISLTGLVAGDQAWGYGASSGGVEIFENVTFISQTKVWYMHDREDWTAPGRHTFKGCRFIARAAESVFQVETLGSGVDTTVDVTDSETNALYVSHRDAPWITQTAANQVADHYQIRVSIAGSEPIGFRTTARGRAFRVMSNSTGSTSTVRLSGTAATALVGSSVIRDGGGGVKGYTYGTLDVSGILVGLNQDVAVTNNLGKRLGNCTVTSKTLTVTVDGGSAQNVVLNADYTAMSNTDVLTAINAGLTGAVADTYLVAQGERYPQFPDRQRTPINTGSTGIPRFAAVKRGTDGRSIELMGTADAVTTFAGVALEAIPPGKVGRILTSGLLDTVAGGLGTSQALGVNTALAVGAPLYLSDTTAGAFATTGTRQIGTGYFTGWAKI